MGKEALTGFISVATAVVVIAIIAVVVSKNANTAGVLTAGGTALSNAIKAAVAPVSNAGANTELNQLGAMGG